MSLFLAKLHVENADGAIITPDILIDRLLLCGADRATPHPIGLLSHGHELQLSGEGHAMRAGYMLITAGAGTLIAPALLASGGQVSLGRMGWRLAHKLSADASMILHAGDKSAPLTGRDSPLAVLASLGDGLGENLPRGVAAFYPMLAPNAGKTRPIVMPMRLQDATSQGSIHHAVTLRDVSAEDWRMRGQGDYASGPQFREVNHYV